MKGYAVFQKSNSSKFKEWNFNNFDLMDFKLPVLKDNEVLIQVKAVSLNPVDYKLAVSDRPLPIDHNEKELFPFPTILGVDGAGIVKRIGEKVTLFKEGDRVMLHQNLWRKNGTYAEYTLAPEHVVSKIPDEMAFSIASSIPCAGYTAFEALFHRLELKKGQSILITGASGGVGSFAVQLAKSIGATVLALCSPRNFSLVKQLGADHVFDYRAKEIVNNTQVRKLFENGVDCALDCVGSQSATLCLKNVKYYGKVATIAGAPDFTQLDDFTTCPAWFPVALGAKYQYGVFEDEAKFRTMGEKICDLWKMKKVKPVICEEMSFEDLKSGLKRLLERKNLKPGKIVCVL